MTGNQHHHRNDSECLLCRDKLLTAHEQLQSWFHELKKEFPDIHIAWAYRNKEEQEKAFREGKSRCHFPKSKHNFERDGLPCSHALDLFELINGQSIFRVPTFAAIDEFNKNMGYSITWGGTFRSFPDRDHFEIE